MLSRGENQFGGPASAWWLRCSCFFEDVSDTWDEVGLLCLLPPRGAVLSERNRTLHEARSILGTGHPR